MRVTFEDRCVGSLLGVACGEILGIPAHGLSIAEIRQKFGELRDFQVGLFACGCYGEATEMTLALAETLTEQGWVDPVRTSAKYADCYQSWRPYGQATRRVLHAMKAGLDHWEMGRAQSDDDSRGSGRAARLASSGSIPLRADRSSPILPQAVDIASSPYPSTATRSCTCPASRSECLSVSRRMRSPESGQFTSQRSGIGILPVFPTGWKPVPRSREQSTLQPSLQESVAMPTTTRRSFLQASAAMLAGAAAMDQARGQEGIAGFDQTRTDYDRTQVWKPFSDRKIRMGLVGYGVCKFSAAFDFQTHPNVEVVAVSDLFPDRCAELSRVVKCGKTYPSLEEMVKDDTIEAIFVATDAPSHARHCIEVLNHGKHVCTAVPAFRGNIDDAERLLDCCRKNRGLVYAMFETSVFHDDLYAMEKIYAAGGFGKIIYSEGEYCHTRKPGDPPIGSYKDWRKNGCPMWYPTHATAYYVGVTHGSFTDVSCQGILPFDESKRVPNAIGNVFHSEIGLFHTSEGGLSRMMVCPAYGVYLEAGRLRGEIGGYDETYTGCDEGKRIVKKLGSSILKYALPPGVSPGGHGGSHGYLSDDFVDAILRGRKPAVDVIDALNMTVPGYYAHISATKDGETVKIPQYSL